MWHYRVSGLFECLISQNACVAASQGFSDRSRQQSLQAALAVSYCSQPAPQAFSFLRSFTGTLEPQGPALRIRGRTAYTRRTGGFLSVKRHMPGSNSEEDSSDSGLESATERLEDAPSPEGEPEGSPWWQQVIDDLGRGQVAEASVIQAALQLHGSSNH